MYFFTIPGWDFQAKNWKVERISTSTQAEGHLFSIYSGLIAPINKLFLVALSCNL